jgi:hypothetical protein
VTAQRLRTLPQNRFSVTFQPSKRTSQKSFPADKPAQTGRRWTGLYREASNVGVVPEREDGRINRKYPLTEAPSASYSQRTEPSFFIDTDPLNLMGKVASVREDTPRCDQFNSNNSLISLPTVRMFHRWRVGSRVDGKLGVEQLGQVIENLVN